MAGTTTWQTMWGIANHLGDPWTSQTFLSERDAQRYLDKERQGWPALAKNEQRLELHRVVPVSVTVTITEKKD